MFRLFAMVWMLAAFVTSFASAGNVRCGIGEHEFYCEKKRETHSSLPCSVQVTVCVITKDVAPVKEFGTKTIAEDKYDETMAAGGLLGPCSDYLGELCDDEDFCTVDYDIEDNTCYALPRDVVDNCAKNE